VLLVNANENENANECECECKCECKCVSAGADTRANTALGGGAPQVGNLCLLEDGGKRSDALGSDVVRSEPVSEEQGEKRCERVGVSKGADTRANTASGGGAPQVGDLRLLEDGGERGGALVSDYVPPQTASGG